ncbi:uncharacterized protein LOC124259326 [Haliotis rubra]|uniref:uncharacterized protein LOC124259326 n=1 Tax=Haliotis rubra TaxID=36100 RepID=UPI001EE5D0D4|nr:uncharacterized protein LOC124259326 [Haliotis rubra]XP_046549405.1 uncharacterized protein LOC124259326 [Haliotis rubra]
MPLYGGKTFTVLSGILQVYVLAHLNRNHLSVVCQPDFRCPELSDLGSSARLFCSASNTDTNIIYSGPGDLDAPHCNLTRGLCTSIAGYTGTVLDANDTELVIHNVQPGMAGSWKCKDDLRSLSSYCTVNAVQIPSCNITSDSEIDTDTDTTSVQLNRSVTVDLKGLYCSTVFNFTLQVGNTRQHLMTSEALDQPTDKNNTLILADTTYGETTLIFTCGNQQRNVTCGGLAHIPKNTENKGTKNTTAAVIGSVVGILVVFVITVGIFTALIVRKKKILT